MASDWECPICMLPFVDLIHACGDSTGAHLFCASCLTRFTGSGCPLCRRPLPANPIQSHAADWERLETCTHCHSEMTRRELRSHQPDCPQRPMSCAASLEGCEWRGPQQEKVAHERSCMRCVCKQMMAARDRKLNELRQETETLKSQVTSLRAQLAARPADEDRQLRQSPQEQDQAARASQALGYVLLQAVPNVATFLVSELSQGTERYGHAEVVRAGRALHAISHLVRERQWSERATLERAGVVEAVLHALHRSVQQLRRLRGNQYGEQSTLQKNAFDVLGYFDLNRGQVHRVLELYTVFPRRSERLALPRTGEQLPLTVTADALKPMYDWLWDSCFGMYDYFESPSSLALLPASYLVRDLNDFGTLVGSLPCFVSRSLVMHAHSSEAGLRAAQDAGAVEALCDALYRAEDGDGMRDNGWFGLEALAELCGRGSEDAFGRMVDAGVLEYFVQAQLNQGGEPQPESILWGLIGGSQGRQHRAQQLAVQLGAPADWLEEIMTREGVL